MQGDPTSPIEPSDGHSPGLAPQEEPQEGASPVPQLSHSGPLRKLVKKLFLRQLHGCHKHRQESLAETNASEQCEDLGEYT